MKAAARLALLAAAAALAACTETEPPAASPALSEPSAVAVFRGYTSRSAELRPYLAIANAGSNDLAIADGVDDALLPAPAPLRNLVYPLPGRPVLLAAADLGEEARPDLLVAVAAGELPGPFGRSRLLVVRTWLPDGAVVDEIDLGADVRDLAALPNRVPGEARVAAALADRRVAVVTFERVDGSDGIRVLRSDPSADLGFRVVDLAAVPGDPGRVWAASPDLLGAAEILVPASGAPTAGRQVSARAPTRLVAALDLWDATPLSTALDSSAFDLGAAPVERVYAVLDESGCGLRHEIACGLVALDPATGLLAADPAGEAPFRAPIPVGRALALGAAPPPAAPPSEAEPEFAGTFMRVVHGSVRTTTGVAGVASADGLLTFVDLGRWEVPSSQPVVANVRATVTATRPFGAAGTQWLALAHEDGRPSTRLDPAGLATAVRVTPGYTPTERWTVTREGILPGLESDRAEVWSDGAPLLALQATGFEAIALTGRLYDPTLGVSAGDLAVLEPTGLGTCGTFEAAVADLVAPTAARPGGAVHLAKRTPANAEWDRCFDLLAAAAPAPDSASPVVLRATFRAARYVLVRGEGAAAIHAGRPEVGAPFALDWESEDPLAAACLLPPSRPWPEPSEPPAPLCAPGPGGCREACERLVRARLARRIGYLSEATANPTGPALAFTLALEDPVAGDPPRGAALVIDTVEGRAPFRVAPTAGVAIDPRAVVPFDRSRSPGAAGAGVRFLVPYAGNAVLDATPTVGGGGITTIR